MSAFHENYIKTFFFSVRDHVLSHIRTDERSQDCPIPNLSPQNPGSFFHIFQRYGEILLVRGNVSEPLKMGVVQKLRGALWVTATVASCGI